ncbi:MAG: S9 family peptidase [Gammaproteobacteria bacterium]|nr:S9 family peptidase [Gammaproteobacteria bacterium]
MSKSSTTSYGNWSSAITSELIVSDSISIAEPQLTSNAIYYIECRPKEAGRCVIVKAKDGITTDILPAPFSARSRVHEYGGASFCLGENQLFFINDSDQDIYRIKDQKITRITNAADQRFADLSVDKKHHRIIAVCETHQRNQVTNTIVSIDMSNGEITTIEQGDDFYASPRLSVDSNQLCWQSWNNPNMPWNGNILWLADIDNTGLPVNKKHIAGADNISVFQPQWSPDNILYFIADDTDWWHLYRHNRSVTNEQLTIGEKEFGLPQWVFGQSSYAFINEDNIVCSYQENGQATLALLSLSEKPTLTKIATTWTHFAAIRTNNKSLCFIAASSESFPQLISAPLTDKQCSSLELDCTVIKSSCQLPVSNKYYSTARHITFTNRHQQQVHANYYPPTNPRITTNTEEKAAPLIVICHGGPTGQSGIALDPKKQFWTSRGFALLDVNYSGSTGYGTKYRERLNKNWGELDVHDCCDAALFAVSQGWANKDQLIIRGSSAGGYTVLAALTFEQVFSAGASYYGISDLSSLATDTHKFEAHYLDKLVGPYPDDAFLYQQRSPINSTDKLNCPVIFFQGVEDKVVPKAQAEKMVEALREKGVPVAAQYFPGEQHGFRLAETIVQSLENELRFYQLIFNLKAKDDIHFKGDIQLHNI